MSDYRGFIEKAEKDVYRYFRFCPFCLAEYSMEFEWGFNKDLMTCSNCGAQWHINHGFTGFHWAALTKESKEERSVELVGKRKDPNFWQQMAANWSGPAPAPVQETPAPEQPEQPERPEPVAEEKETTKEETAPKVEAERPLWWNLLKYFLHGVFFSVLFLVLGLVWAVILVILTAFGAFIGIIIGLILLFLLIGGINSFLADMIWSVTVKTDWKNLLGHGLVLFILLIIVQIPAIIINLVRPSLATTVAVFLVYAFIDGFVGKSIAGYFEGEYGEID